MCDELHSFRKVSSGVKRKSFAVYSMWEDVTAFAVLICGDQLQTMFNLSS